MAIWNGYSGGVRIERQVTGILYAQLRPEDVDAGANRFSVDRVTKSLVTGDKVWVRRVDEVGNPVSDLLDFVTSDGWPDGQVYSDGQWYVAVDPVGGVRLYQTWSDALNATTLNSVQLVEPAAGYRISLEVMPGVERWLAQTQSWELNTNRDVADITSLGDGFQKRMATLVSGAGSLDCIFDVPQGMCANEDDNEFSSYLHQLVLRQEIGSVFKGVFLLKRKGCMPFGGAEDIRAAELFYAANCVITGVATEITMEDEIHSEIAFVTTGEIQLLYSYPADYLMQESPPNSRILQESDFGVALETPA